MQASIRLMSTVLLLTFVTVAGCVSVQDEPTDPAERLAYLKSEVESLLEEEKPARALQDTIHYGSTGVFDTETSKDFYRRSLEQLVALFEADVANSRYESALAHFDSLARLSNEAKEHFLSAPADAEGSAAGAAASVLDDYSRSGLRQAQAKQLLEEGNKSLALTLLTEIDSWEELGTDTVQRFVEAAISQKNRFALERLSEELSERGTDLPEAARPLLESQATPSEMVEGTVTVWVDRGIRIERGAGVPDRVIGSGFFIDERGYVLTNYHVVSSEVDPTYEGYSRLYVRLPGKPDQRIKAEVVGYDRIFDVALLKVPIEPEFTFSFTQIRELAPGERILTIGSPGGLQSSISSGIISATDRRFLQIGEVLQVDLPVNPGNSGGPIFDGRGRLVGIVFAGIEQFEGVNFAIPSYWVRPLLSDLFAEGEVQHAWLGVAVADNNGRLEVTYVAPGSPAEDVGVHVGDELKSLNGSELSGIAEAQDMLLRMRIDELVGVTFERDGTEMRKMIALGRRPHRPVEKALESQEISEVFAPLFGMTTNEVGRLPWQRRFVVTNVYPGSIADETGLSENDPFSLLDWRYSEEQRAVGIQIVVKKRKAGFLETAVQLAAPIETNNFL